MWEEMRDTAAMYDSNSDKGDQFELDSDIDYDCGEEFRERWVDE